MNSENSSRADVKGLTESLRQLSDHVRRYKSSNPDLRNLEVQVKPSDKDAQPNLPDSLRIIITFEADTQAHAELHANEMLAANPAGSTSCTSSGPTSVTCEYTE